MHACVHESCVLWGGGGGGVHTRVHAYDCVHVCMHLHNVRAYVRGVNVSWCGCACVSNTSVYVVCVCLC